MTAPMTTNELLEKHQNRVAEIVRYQAGCLAAMPAFAGEDPEDLSQELWLRFLPLAKHYDPSRAEFGAFASSVIANLAIDWVRSAIPDQKNRPETVSLSDPVKQDGRTVERGETLASTDDETRARDLRHDLRVVIAKLPPELQTLCALLAENPALGVEGLALALSRTRFRVETQLREIRRHFRRHGMHHYLKD